MRHEITTEEIGLVFDVKHRLEDMGTMTYMADPIEGHVGEEVYRMHKTEAGEYRYEDLVSTYVIPKGRTKQMELTSEARQRATDERKLRELEMLANNNFTAADMHLTLTYRREARSDKQVNADVRNFLRRLQRARQKAGLPPAKYIGRIEGSDEEYKRRHVHLMISGGMPREEVEAIWDKGWCNMDRLQPGDEGLRPLVRYIFKGYRGARDRYGRAHCRYIRSRNLVKPKTRITQCRLSNRRIRAIVADMGDKLREVLEKANPGYKLVDAEVRTSTFAAGVAVRAILKKY